MPIGWRINWPRFWTGFIWGIYETAWFGMSEQVECRWKPGDKVRYWPLGRQGYISAVVVGLSAKRVRIEIHNHEEQRYQRRTISVKPRSLSASGDSHD